MLGLVRRTELEKAEAETRMVLAHFIEAVAAAKQTTALLAGAQARYNELLRIVDNWHRMYDAKAAELKSTKEALDVARWALRVPGTENGCPHALMGDYVEGGH